MLRATRVWDDDPVRLEPPRAVHRGRRSTGARCPSYVDEEGIDPARGHRDARRGRRWRWTPGAGRACRSGCARARRSATAARRSSITFKRRAAAADRPDRLRPAGPAADRSAAPTGSAWTSTSTAGRPVGLDPVTLEADFGAGRLPRVRRGARGRPRGRPDRCRCAATPPSECWRIVEPVLAAWRDDGCRCRSTPPAAPGRATRCSCRGQDPDCQAVCALGDRSRSAGSRRVPDAPAMLGIRMYSRERLHIRPRPAPDRGGTRPPARTPEQKHPGPRSPWPFPGSTGRAAAARCCRW